MILSMAELLGKAASIINAFVDDPNSIQTMTEAMSWQKEFDRWLDEEPPKPLSEEN